MPAPDRPPSFPMYPLELLADEHVEAMEHLPGPGRHIAFAGYLRLLLKLWLEPEPGRIRADDARLARLSGLGDLWPEFRDAIAQCFVVESGWWVQKRMVRERELQLIRYKRAILSGSKGGRKSKQKRQMGSNPAATLQQPSRVPVGLPTPGGLSPARGVQPLPDPDPGPDPDPERRLSVPRTELSAEPGAVPAGTAGLRTQVDPTTEHGVTRGAAGMSSIAEVILGVMPNPVGTLTGADLRTDEGVAMERDAQLRHLQAIDQAERGA